MGRRFNPLETVFIKPDALPKPTERSLYLFLETLISHGNDDRITTKPGRVEFADTYEGKQITLVLDVKDSIRRALAGDNHVSLGVKVEGRDSTRYPCVQRLGSYPVGDHMSNIIGLFHNNVLIETINTIENAVRSDIHFPRWRQDGENDPIWRELYDELTFYQPNPIHEIVDQYWYPLIVDLPYEVMLDIVRRIVELNCDLERNFGAEQRRQMLISMIELPICIDARRYIVARLGEDWDAMEPLQRLTDMLQRDEVGHEDPEGCLLRASEYAINRIRARQDSNPRNPA